LNPYSEEKIYLSVTEDDKVLLDLLGISYQPYVEEGDSSFCRITVTENAIDLLNSLSNEEVFDVLDKLTGSILNFYGIGESFLEKRIEDIFTRLSEQYATTLDTRVKEMLPLVVEEFEKEHEICEQEVIQVITSPIELIKQLIFR